MQLSLYIAHLQSILADQGELDVVAVNRTVSLQGVRGVHGVLSATLPAVVPLIIQSGDKVNGETGSDARFVEMRDARISDERRRTFADAGKALLLVGS